MYLRLFILLCCLAVLFTAGQGCKSQKSKDASNAATQATTAGQATGSGKAPAMVQVPVDELPPPSASRRAYLTTGWWNFNMAIQTTDSLIHLNYQSKWLKFREDQTFDVLIKGKVVDTGRWNFDDPNQIIYLSCKDPYINNTWKVIEKGFVMIWAGNTNINITGIQIRVANLRTPPPTE